MTNAQFLALVNNDIANLVLANTPAPAMITAHEVAIAVVEEIGMPEIAHGQYAAETQLVDHQVFITLDNGQRFKITVEAQ